MSDFTTHATCKEHGPFCPDDSPGGCPYCPPEEEEEEEDAMKREEDRVLLEQGAARFLSRCQPEKGLPDGCRRDPVTRYVFHSDRWPTDSEE